MIRDQHMMNEATKKQNLMRENEEDGEEGQDREETSRR